MYSLLQSNRARGSDGKPLPTVFKTLEDADVHLRRGQMVLISAGPGCGKSLLGLNIAIKSDVTCVYHSADSGAFTQLARSISVILDIPLKESEQMVLSGDVEKQAETLANQKIRFSYDSRPTLDKIKNTVDAYEELYGDYPELVVVDNYLNVVGEDEDNEDVMAFLDQMAKETQACVLLLHHTLSEYNNSDRPIPMNGVKNQITALPPMVFTLYRPADDPVHGPIIGLSVVKNRGGEADPTGRKPLNLQFLGFKAQIVDLPTEEVELDDERQRYEIEMH